jgi:hypothetical protein
VGHGRGGLLQEIYQRYRHGQAMKLRKLPLILPTIGKPRIAWANDVVRPPWLIGRRILAVDPENWRQV